MSFGVAAAASLRVEALSGGRGGRGGFAQKALSHHHFLCNRRSCPKSRFDSKLVHLVNQDNDVMTEYLAQRLIDHRGVGLATQEVAEFSLHHAECAFGVGPPMVVDQELFAVQTEVVICPLKRSTYASRCAKREGDVRRNTPTISRLEICLRRVLLVCREFFHGESLRSARQKRRQERAIVSVSLPNLYRRDDVGFHAGHDVNLHPIVLLPHLTVFVIEPAMEPRSCKAARIHRKVHFNRSEWQTAFGDQTTQDWGQGCVFQVVENRVEVRHPGDESPLIGFTQVADEASSGEGRIHLERGAEDRIGQRNPGAPASVGRWFLDAAAQVMKQNLEPVFFVGLGSIVGSPVLGIRAANCMSSLHPLCDRRGSIAVVCPFDCVANRENMFADDSACFVIWAGAMRTISVKVNGVPAIASLGWHKPRITTPVDATPSRDFQATLLSGVHSKPLFFFGSSARMPLAESHSGRNRLVAIPPGVVRATPGFSTPYHTCTSKHCQGNLPLISWSGKHRIEAWQENEKRILTPSLLRCSEPAKAVTPAHPHSLQSSAGRLRKEQRRFAGQGRTAMQNPGGRNPHDWLQPTETAEQQGDWPMTIVAGIVAKDGVVLAADSQAGMFRGVQVKRTDYTKIYQLGGEPDSKVRAVVAGAGMVAFITKAVNHLKEEWEERRFSSAGDLEQASEKVMMRLAKKYFFDRMRELGIEDMPHTKGVPAKRLQEGPMQVPKALLLLGAADVEGGKTLLTVGPEGIAEREERYTSIGSGSAYAEYILSRLYSDTLSVEQAMECAVYTIEEVKKMDQDCGGPVRAVAATAYGIVNRGPDDLRDMVNKLQIRDELLAKMWRAMVLGRKSASDVQSFLDG